MIKQANMEDTKYIEEIMLDAVNWLQRIGMENKWTKTSVLWENLSKSYQITDFFIAWKDGKPAACMALTDYDSTYWPEIQKGESLYVHKLAVKREYAGKGCSKELMDYAKQLAKKQGIKTLRLDCNRYRKKLRNVYEKQGFVCVKEEASCGDSGMVLYVCEVE